MSERKRFKAGDLVVPLDEEQAHALLRQNAEEVGTFPWRVYTSEDQGRNEFLLFECPNGEGRGYYAYRFKLASVPDKPLEDYM